MQKTRLMREMSNYIRMRGYSPKTLKTYLHCFSDFYDKTYNIYTVDGDKIMAYLIAKRDQGYSSQTVNLYLNAIKFFYRWVIPKRFPSDIRFAKKTKRLPVVLEKEEIHLLLNSIKNSKHRIMVALAYGAGLRVGEVVALRVQDINYYSKTIRIRHGKGDKERITMLPEKLELPIKTYCTGKAPTDFLIESERGGKLSTRTAQAVFKKALKKAKIIKPATFHSLRHSFATHLLQSGVDIVHIQQLLGHNKITTTQIYIKVNEGQLGSIRSPL